MILAVIYVVNKLKKSSHEIDEAGSSLEESAHIVAQNIESEATNYELTIFCCAFFCAMLL
jgi:hypothetical protein